MLGPSDGPIMLTQGTDTPLNPFKTFPNTLSPYQKHMYLGQVPYRILYNAIIAGDRGWLSCTGKYWPSCSLLSGVYRYNWQIKGAWAGS